MPKKTTYFAIVCTILMCMCSSSIAQTKSIHGVINQYSRVLEINRMARTVTLEDASMFQQGDLRDTVLLIQMTGISVTGNDLGDKTKGEAGTYEFHIVTHVSGSTVTLLTTPDIYNTNEFVQLIRVPSFKNATIDGILSCKQWESGTGGVLALMVEGTLIFNADIDISGRGFRGGKASNTPYSGPCSFNTTDRTNLRDYTEADDLAGNKGEGAVTVDYFNPNDPSSNLKGYWPTWNGGGGGNGKWSGGGGGGNYRGGGIGGDQACNVPGYVSGNGGNPIKYNEFKTSERIFMGGGGGAGTGEGTDGGNGGGIVIILAKKLQFNLNTVTGEPTVIKANGGSVDQRIDKGGAGGGGAGGTILLSVQEYGDIRAQIRGGNGGSVNRITCSNTENSMGAGGGGGGGFMQISNDMSQLSNWDQAGRLQTNGGEAGRVITTGGASCQNSTGNFPGWYSLEKFQVQLKGFLNNYLTPLSDPVCYGEPVTIQASQPVGGTGIYTDYEWQSSEDHVHWVKLPAVSLTKMEYSFFRDTYVRRVITSGTADYSTPILIKVYNDISNNTVAPADTTLCWRKEKLKIRGSMPTDGGGGGPYTFEWENLNDSEEDNNTTNKDLFIQLQAGGGKQSYRRRAISHYGCFSSWSTAVFHVIPAIVNELAPPVNPDVCEVSTETLTGTLSGGYGTHYYYKWEFTKDINNVKNWREISQQPDYHPVLDLNDYGEYFYRRIVTSGVCKDTSNVVKIRFDRQPELSEFEIRTNGQTGDQVLKFLFTASLEVIQPIDAGIGRWEWSSTKDLQGEKPFFSPDDEPKTTVNNLKFNINTITWEVTNGVCSTVPVSVNIIVEDIIVYNALSPNDDGKNDCFFIDGGENATSSELTIFDRYNNVVFKSSMDSSEIRNCTCWWDGRSSSGKELPSGTYYFHLILNKEKEKRGYVVLKRQ